MPRARRISRCRWACLLVLLGAAVLAGSCAHRARPAAAPPLPSASAPTPSPVLPSPALSSPGSPTPPPPSRTAAPSLPPNGVRRYAFPVPARDVAYYPTHAIYPATDIFADCGEPVVAVTDGRILEVSRIDRYSESGPQGPYNGGLSVSLLGGDGVRYYGSHLSQIAPGISAGISVRAGQRLGAVGRTGHANNVCHLHFGMSPPCRMIGDWWIRRGVVWPASYLDAWRKRRPVSPVAVVRAWHHAHGCPSAP